MKERLETKQDDCWNSDWEDLCNRLRTQITSSRWTRAVLIPCPTCGHVRLQRTEVLDVPQEGE